MSLILDHINGVHDDNRLENLRILCPNCNATLDTHCGRQNRIPVGPRECELCRTSFMPGYPKQRFCSVSCGRRARGSHAPRPGRRKVARPTLKQLRTDLQSMSYLAVGRMYGVSDTAVRKWIRSYERIEPTEPDG